MRSHTLPSGAKLDLHPAPFTEARDLYQALMEELKSLKLDPGAEVDVNFYKDLVCTGLSSKKVEAALLKCMARSLYNGLRITDATFEPVQAREDYIPVCVEIVTENITPFMKSLFASFQDVLKTVQSALASRLPTTPSS